MRYQPHPLRIQLRRTKGWRKPEGAIVVSRPSKWGNPMWAGIFAGYTTEDAVRDFRRWLNGDNSYRSLGNPPSLEEITRELRGKQLACWCPLDKPCHADVLAEIANWESL